MTARVHVGCAGWALRTELQPRFPGGGTHLERYARVFSCVEINSSFYRPHLPPTYAKWRDSVPADFRFSVKLPRTVTHERRLADCAALLDDFAFQAGRLKEKLGCLLVQLPPSLAFEARIAAEFFAALAERLGAPTVCEPRHPSWFAPDAYELQQALGVGYVFADPAVGEVPTHMCGRLAYFRMHGSPRMYYSVYAAAELERLKLRIIDAAEHAEAVWTVFDNTADGHAVPNALELQALLGLGAGK